MESVKPLRKLEAAVATPPSSRHPVPHHLARFLLRPLFRVYFRMQAEGLEHLPRSGAYILAPNHVSMLDWAFICYFLPRLTRFVVHREYYDNPVLRFGLRINGAVSLRTDSADLGAMRTLRNLLASGEPVILFPEGGISLDGRPQRFHSGIISISGTANVPIVPVALRGAFEAFPRWRSVPRPGRVTVVFGAPLAPPPRGDRARLAQLLRERVTDLLDGKVCEDPFW